MFRIVRQYVPFVLICLRLSICLFRYYMFRIVRQYVPLSFMLALNVGQRRIAERKINSRCPHLVGVRDRLPGSLRAGAHPEIWPSIARSLSRDGMAIFKIQTYLTRVTCTRVQCFDRAVVDPCLSLVLITQLCRNQLVIPPIVLGYKHAIPLSLLVVFFRCTVRLRVSLSLSDWQQIPFFFLFNQFAGSSVVPD